MQTIGDIVQSQQCCGRLIDTNRRWDMGLNTMHCSAGICFSVAVACRRQSSVVARNICRLWLITGARMSCGVRHGPVLLIRRNEIPFADTTKRLIYMVSGSARWWSSLMSSPATRLRQPPKTPSNDSPACPRFRLTSLIVLRCTLLVFLASVFRNWRNKSMCLIMSNASTPRGKDHPALSRTRTCQICVKSTNGFATLSCRNIE